MAGVKDVLESVREEDFVEYYIFPSIETSDEKEQEAILSTALNKIKKIIKQYTSNYIWHKDAFKLLLRTTNSNNLTHLDGKTEKLPPHLYGVSHYGDNIEDEWFMVFLLREISKEISDFIIKVHDVDGEFLLIEAADYLPQWANPDTCQNRVYICDGKLHIVPLENLENTTEIIPITVTEALSIIKEKTTETMASLDIQNSINSKLQGYPEKIPENLHRATIFLPIGVAAILKQKPNLIAPAVQAFCNRDPIDVKVCKAMRYFPPENRVNSSVVFTKCLYAMLLHSKYVPDRRTGWNLPPINSPEYKAHLLGIKVACGFEILVSQAKPSENIEQDRGWQNYLKSLNDKNYFNNLLENSRDYNNLLNKAKEYYINHRDSMQIAPAIGQEILHLTKTHDYKPDELKREEENLPKDDDESWLNISSEELDKMLQEKYGQKKIFTVNNNTDASEFSEKVSKFLNNISDVDGAEFPNHESPVRPPRSRKGKTKVSFSPDSETNGNKKPMPSSNNNNNNSNNNKVNFNPDQFSCAVQNILNFMIPEDDSWDLESGSDMSDYEEDNYVKEQSYEDVKNKMQEYMEQMDKELAGTTIGESFEKKNGDGFDDIENFKPVDIDVNALKNILESYRSQLGEAGPSSNMLGPMGLHLDTNGDVD